MVLPQNWKKEKDMESRARESLWRYTHSLAAAPQIKTHLYAVNVGFNVAGLVQVKNVHGPKESATLGKSYWSNPIQDLLARGPPSCTLGLTVAMNCLNAVTWKKTNLYCWHISTRHLLTGSYKAEGLPPKDMPLNYLITIAFTECCLKRANMPRPPPKINIPGSVWSIIRIPLGGRFLFLC